MTRAVLRALAVLGVLALLHLGVRVLGFVLACEWEVGAVAARATAPGEVMRSGYVVASPTDEIFVCRSRHCFAPPYLCHEDVVCYCVPAASHPTPASVGAIQEARGRADLRCTLDHEHPTRDDESGACRHARCAEHLDGR